MNKLLDICIYALMNGLYKHMDGILVTTRSLRLMIMITVRCGKPRSCGLRSIF